jgi:hypothetical protein
MADGWFATVGEEELNKILLYPQLQLQAEKKTVAKISSIK